MSDLKEIKEYLEANLKDILIRKTFDESNFLEVSFHKIVTENDKCATVFIFIKEDKIVLTDIGWVSSGYYKESNETYYPLCRAGNCSGDCGVGDIKEIIGSNDTIHLYITCDKMEDLIKKMLILASYIRKVVNDCIETEEFLEKS